MLYEHIVSIEPQKCIALSESLERSNDNIASMETYLLKLREMIEILKQTNRPVIKQQPLFVWHDRNSASWKFEEYRVLHTLHKMLMAEAKSHFDQCEYMKAKQLLARAVEVCKEMVAANFVKTPYIRGMPELQKEYALALLFRTKGTYCFNAHMWKTTPAVAKMAYKFVELSNAVWKRGANKDYENKVKAHYHYAVASTSEDFKEIISHSSEAVKIFNDPKMLEDHEKWMERNNTVHFETPDAVTIPLFDLTAAFEKC